MTFHDMLERRPNLVLVVLRETGTFFSIYGRPDVYSQWFDSMAYSGMLGDHVYSMSPTPAAMDSLLTGRWPVPADAPTLLQIAAEHDYLTYTIGADADGNGNASSAVDAAIDIIIDRAPHPEEPFAMLVDIAEASPPYDADIDPEMVDAIAIPPGIEDTPENRRKVAMFYGHINILDHHLARLFEELEDRGVEDDTLFIVTSDCGPAIPGHQGELDSGGLHVPLMLRWPSILPGGWRMPELLSTLDLMPTILDVLQFPKPADLEGRSFFSLLSREGLYHPRESITITDPESGDTWTVDA